MHEKKEIVDSEETSSSEVNVDEDFKFDGFFKKIMLMSLVVGVVFFAIVVWLIIKFVKWMCVILI